MTRRGQAGSTRCDDGSGRRSPTSRFRIDHVGSTAVPGLAAKPIIDIDIVVASEDQVGTVIERLATDGYRWRGDLGVVGREAFDARHADGLPRHHLYVVVENNRAHLYHADPLRGTLCETMPRLENATPPLKRRNAQLANNDMDVYVAAKATLVAQLLTRARAERGLPPETYWSPGTPTAHEPAISDVAAPRRIWLARPWADRGSR